jgi:hypothetical protein
LTVAAPCTVDSEQVDANWTGERYAVTYSAVVWHRSNPGGGGCGW